jgi:hypothetical protein
MNIEGLVPETSTVAEQTYFQTREIHTAVGGVMLVRSWWGAGLELPWDGQAGGVSDFGRWEPELYGWFGAQHSRRRSDWSKVEEGMCK